MNKILLTTAITMIMGSTVAFEHHPAVKIVDPEVYAIIDENVSDVHAYMTFDDMGGDTTDVGSSEVSEDGELVDTGSAMDTRAIMS